MTFAKLSSLQNVLPVLSERPYQCAINGDAAIKKALEKTKTNVCQQGIPENMYS